VHKLRATEPPSQMVVIGCWLARPGTTAQQDEKGQWLHCSRIPISN